MESGVTFWVCQNIAFWGTWYRSFSDLEINRPGIQLNWIPNTATTWAALRFMYQYRYLKFCIVLKPKKSLIPCYRFLIPDIGTLPLSTDCNPWQSLYISLTLLLIYDKRRQRQQQSFSFPWSIGCLKFNLPFSLQIHDRDDLQSNWIKSIP
jgi:hypothetical protein